MVSYPLVVLRDEYTDDTTCYVAYHPDLPGCMAQGDTAQAAANDLNSLRPEWIAHVERDGLKVPEPGSSQVIMVHADGSQTVIVTVDRRNLWGDLGYEMNADSRARS